MHSEHCNSPLVSRRSITKLGITAPLATLLSSGLSTGSVNAGLTGLSYLEDYVRPQNNNLVFAWTDIMLQATRDTYMIPPEAGRAFAMAHVAGFNAINSILGRYGDTMNFGKGPSGANAAAAYHTAMSIAHSEAFQRSFMPDRNRFLKQIPNSEAKSLGIKWGKIVGKKLVRSRTKDGSDQTKSTIYRGRYKKRNNVMAWEPTLPSYNSGVGPRIDPYVRGLFPGWGYIRPFGVPSILPFRANRFPHPKSQEFRADYLKIQNIGSAKSPYRTADQSQIAFFWEDGAGGATTAGRFMIIAAQLMQGKMDTYDLARQMCFVAMAIADAGIAAWDNKYHYDILRPDTAFRERMASSEFKGMGFKNLPNWKSLILTPPFPAYISGHSTFGAAGMRAIWNALGTNNIRYSLQPTDLAWWPEQLKGVSRNYTSLWQAAEENGLSRLFGGVHWTFDHTEGMRIGRQLADAAFATHFPRVA